MIQAMYSGVSGMKAFKANLDVVGNNIANVNTVGYKASRASFKEMLNRTLSGASSPTGLRGGVNASQVGMGVNIGSIDIDGTQGSIQATGRQTDLAIEGNGFFALGDGSGVTYTRDGTFALDATNNLVSASTGLKVLGWTAEPATGDLDTTTAVTGSSGITLPIGQMSLARQTTEMNVGGNLNAGADPGDEYSIKYDIYDSLGLTHEVVVTFEKTDNPSEWAYTIECPDVDPDDPVQTGNVQFDSEGHSLVSSVDVSLTLADPNGSTTPLEASLNLASVSQLNGQYTVDLVFQDGLQLGTLESFSIDRSGVISGSFTNGSTRVLGQIALAEFSNAVGLTKLGNNLLGESPNSGTPQIGTAGTGSRGSIATGFLEASNVDLANEFANMIVAQRGFQANSRIITVSDEVLQDLVSLKR